MILKSKIFCGLTCSIEWFDFALYGYFGPIFSKIFFPQADQSKWAALMTTYLIFAIGFAARPLGALIFGYLGDKYGRIVSLRITPLAISFFTALMALLPTYKSIGSDAAILLTIIRFFQGIFLGGEFSGNIVYLCESSRKWRYAWGSIASSTATFGILLASITASSCYFIFSTSFMYEYGWRIAFLFSIPLGIISFMVRLKMSESLEFKDITPPHNPIKEAFLNHKRPILLCVGLLLLHSTSFYFIFMFLPLFLNKVRHLHEGAALVHNTIFLLTHLCFISIFGLIVNKIGGVRSQLISGVLFLFLSVPIFYFIAYGTLAQVVVSIFSLSLMSSLNAAIIPGLLTEIIATEVRYTILGLSFNIGFGIFGGITPFLGLYLIKISGNIMLPSIYLSGTSLLTLVTLYITSKSRE